MIAPKPTNSDCWECLITHGSVIRAVVDYVLLALKDRGSVMIADAPQEDSAIKLIIERVGIDSLLDFYRKYSSVPISFVDLRDKYRVTNNGIYTGIQNLPADPHGNVRVDLGAHSYLHEHDGEGRRYYGAFYDINETNKHHSDGRHEYMISKSALEADVFLSVPKLKTHKKVGITLNLKSLVGINGNKNWLPHYSIGSPENKGDQFPSRSPLRSLENSLVLHAKKALIRETPIVKSMAGWLRPAAYGIFGQTSKVVRSGNWHGNDTCWRMCLDLNRILLYANADGSFRDKPKRYFSIVDGVIGMEGDGPVAGWPKEAGLVAAGHDPVAVDAVCAAWVGFDYRRLSLLNRAFDEGAYRLATTAPGEICVLTCQASQALKIDDLLSKPPIRFQPHFGWENHLKA